MTEFTDYQLTQLIENAHEHRWARTLRVLANELLQVRKQCYLLTRDAGTANGPGRVSEDAMNDVLQRTRRAAKSSLADRWELIAAADEIERLQKENERLEQTIADAPHADYCSFWWYADGPCNCWKKEFLSLENTA